MIQYGIWVILIETADPEETGVLADEALEIGKTDKCIVRSAVIVERNARCLLGQPGVNPFSAASVLKKRAAVRIQEDLEIATIGNPEITHNLRQ